MPFSPDSADSVRLVASAASGITQSNAPHTQARTWVEGGLLAVIIAAYLVIAGLYAIKTPPWQVPDEPAHYNYIAQVVQNGAIPVLQMGDWDTSYLEAIKAAKFAPSALGTRLNTIRYEDHQPPLYYLLQAPVYALSGGSLIAMRLFSVLIGVGVIIFAYLTIRTLFPAQVYLALATAAFVAFLPQHVAMLAGVENDSLAELLIGATLWACVIYLQGKRISPAVIGLLLGLALLTKVTTYLLIGVVAVALIVRALREKPTLRHFLSDGAAIALPALILGGIWWVHCIQVYGFPDFLGLNRHGLVVAGQPLTADYFAQRGFFPALGDAIQTTFHSFWGQFGWMGVLLPGILYTVLTVFTVICILGAVIAFFRFRAKLSPVQRDGLLMLAACGLLAIAEIVYYNLGFEQFQGRYLYPGLIPIAFGFVVGLVGWLSFIPARAIRWLAPIGMFAFAALSVYALFRLIIPNLSF